jgi:DNA-binding MarR family transcriptional regulator
VPARELLHVVMLVMRTLAAEMRRVRTPVGPAQFGLLVKMTEGPCSMSDLARHNAVSLPTISKSVDMLVRRGWVARSPSSSDRRQTLVGLTASGRRVMARVAQQAERHVGLTLSRLTASERDDITRALGRLTALLATPDDSPCS